MRPAAPGTSPGAGEITHGRPSRAAPAGCSDCLALCPTVKPARRVSGRATPEIGTWGDRGAGGADQGDHGRRPQLSRGSGPLGSARCENVPCLIFTLTAL
jgi:hypothetical protein